jgi:nicotinate phosphoribosyltransferase
MNRILPRQTEDNLSLFTDLYELTMCASYFDNRRFESATFDLFIRRLPKGRSYFLFAGLEQVLYYLRNVKFTDEHIAYLRRQGFKDDFLDYLRGFRFSGEVWAVPEGSVVFPNEPLIRVTAPIIEAQLVETFLLNTINLQTMIASKAARVVHAAKSKAVVEFGLRREHGVDAGMKAARASYIAGCRGTSNVLAGLAYNIPVFGTMAHSFVMSFPHEIDAFRAFAKTFPAKSTLLIDTYDDIAAVQKAVIVAKELEKEGFALGGVRLDSGNIAEISKKVRAVLNANGLDYVTIFGSGDLDEYKIASLLSRGARIDAFGVGTKMGTSADYPYIDVIYKLSEIGDGQGGYTPIMKLSKDKLTLPGRKQVYRFADKNGKMQKDLIALADEPAQGEALLSKVMEDGEIAVALPSLNEIRNAAALNLARLPEKHKRLNRATLYSVEVTPAISALTNTLKEKIRKTEIQKPAP